MKFEYLKIAGSHQDMGHAIGSKFKVEIQRRVNKARQTIEGYDDYLKRTEPYFNATKEAFPNLILEAEAIASSAGVSVSDYFAINNREVSKKSGSDHCTVAVSFGKNGAIIGHNEDWEGASPDALYILKATIGDTTFFGLQYKVCIPGIAVSMNNWGLVQCINDLNNSAQIGVPKNFVARAVLQCKTLDEAELLIRKTKRASGFNHVLIQGREVRNIEIAGDKLAIQKTVEKPYVHTNHYLSPEMVLLEKTHTQSSEKRYQMAMKKIKSDMTVEDMQLLLSDTNNAEYPISRHDATLGSFVAVPSESSAYICYGPPDEGEYIKYK